MKIPIAPGTGGPGQRKTSHILQGPSQGGNLHRGVGVGVGGSTAAPHSTVAPIKIPHRRSTQRGEPCWQPFRLSPTQFLTGMGDMIDQPGNCLLSPAHYRALALVQKSRKMFRKTYVLKAPSGKGEGLRARRWIFSLRKANRTLFIFSTSSKWFPVLRK